MEARYQRLLDEAALLGMELERFDHAGYRVEGVHVPNLLAAEAFVMGYGTYAAKVGRGRRPWNIAEWADLDGDDVCRD